MAMEPVPAVIGEDYDVLQLVGRGNFGTVHLVRARDDGKYYVVKRIDTREMSPSELEGAVGEIQLLRRLHHPFIVRYRDSFLLGGILHLVMHYCEGGDLASQIRGADGKHFPEEKILDWFVQIALALQYCHRHRIIHRDIKSQNIFLTDNHQVMLGDFGIARVLEGTNELAMSVVGTPYSMSPEVCENRPYGYASDIWALGCVLYEMCMLRHAFDANNLLGLVWKIVQENYPPIPSMYSSNLRELIKSMLQKQPEARPTIEQILVLDFIQARIRAMQEAAEQQSQVGEASVIEDIDANTTIGSFGSYHGDAGGTFSSLPPPTELEFHTAVPQNPSAARGYERFGAVQGFLSDDQLRSSAQSSDGTEELEAHADLQAVDEEELRREEENAAQFWSGQQNGLRPATGSGGEIIDPHFDRRQYAQYGVGTPSSTASAGSAGGHFGRDKSSPSNMVGQDPRSAWNPAHAGQTLSGYTPQPAYGAPPPPTAQQQHMSSRDRVLYQKQMAKKMEEERYREQLKALNSVNANSREEAKQRYFKNLAPSQHGAPAASGSPRTPQLQPPIVPGGVPPERRGSTSSSGPASPAGGFPGGVRSDQIRSRSAIGAGPVPLNNPFSQARSPPYSSHAIQHPSSAQPMSSPPYGYQQNARGDMGAYNFQRHQSDSPVAYHGDRGGYDQAGHWRAAPEALDQYGEASLIDMSHPQFNGGEYYDERVPAALHARAHSATPSFEGYPVPSLADPKPGVLRSRGPPPSIRTREDVRAPASYPGSPASAGIAGDRSSVSSSSPYAHPRDHVRVLDQQSQAAALGTPRVADRSLASYGNGGAPPATANNRQYSPPISQAPSGVFVPSPSYPAAAGDTGEDEQYEEDFETYEDSDTEDQDSWRNRTLKMAIQPLGAKASAPPSASNTSLPSAAAGGTNKPRVPPLKTAAAAPPPLAREPSEIVPFNSRHDALKNKILKQLTRPQFDKAYRYFHDRSNAAADPASLPDPREALGAELADVRNWDAVFLVEQLVFMEALPVFKPTSAQ